MIADLVSLVADFASAAFNVMVLGRNAAELEPELADE